MQPRRVRDDGRSLAAFMDEVLVRCPRCGGRARIAMRRQNGPEGKATFPARLTCPGCGLSRAQRLPPSVAGSYCLSADGRDPFFGLPLWLATPTRHGVLFAYNEAHLVVLEGIVGASLRERHSLPPSYRRNATMQSRLPRWMKLARNRGEVLRGLTRLRQRLAEAGSGRERRMGFDRGRSGRRCSTQ